MRIGDLRRSAGRAYPQGACSKTCSGWFSVTGETCGSPPGDLPRVRRRHRKAGLDLPHRFHIQANSADTHGPKAPTSGSRQREHVEVRSHRQDSRHRLLPSWLADTRQLRRRSARQQSFRQLARRARHRTGKQRGTSDGASRYMGLRPDHGTKLLTVRHNGKPVDIVAQATKRGLCSCSTASPGRRSGR